MKGSGKFMMRHSGEWHLVEVWDPFAMLGYAYAHWSIPSFN